MITGPRPAPTLRRRLELQLQLLACCVPLVRAISSGDTARLHAVQTRIDLLHWQLGHGICEED